MNSMTAENQTAEMYSGDSKLIEVTVTESDDTEHDMSGSDLTFKIGNKVTKRSTDNEISVTGSGNNVAEVELEPSDTDKLDGTFQMELEEETEAGDVATLMRGHITIKEDLIT